VNDSALPAVETQVPPGEIILTARDLGVTFPRDQGPDLAAVRGFSIDIRQGEFVGLMGEPGCGKSTAALALMGLVRSPGRISGGSVTLLGHDLLTLPTAQLEQMRGRDIGLIVQNPRTSLHPLMRVGTQIANVYQAHAKVGPRAAFSHAVEMLRMVGINDPQRRARAYPHELSTGMTQRVLIAMALSSSPRLLIADEPTSGLDVTIQTQLLDQMWEAARATGSAVLLVTQQLSIVANYCDRLLLMKDGAIVDQGFVREMLSKPAARANDRGMPSVSPVKARETDPLIDVRDLTKHFAIRGSSAKVHAVDRVSFQIRARECLGLVGESGSGKTTTGRCLLRLEEPTSGEIRFHGSDVTGLGAEDMRRLRSRLQIVFQDPFDAMNPRWTVRQVIGELLDLHMKLTAEARERRIDEMLTLVGLSPNLKDAYPRQLSAGPQQRVAIARAIAPNPEFLVLDEPTSALTATTTAGIIRLLRNLSEQLGLAMLFISHDLTTVQNLCDRVAVMYLGQIVELGSKEQVFGAPAHPYSRALLAAHLFPDLEHRRVDRERQPVMRGEIPSPIDLPIGCYLYGRCTEQRDPCRTTPQQLEQAKDGRSVRCWRVAAGEI
jgi:oligopeptide/dipeptide ABC transporter ATP-binding protein